MTRVYESSRSDSYHPRLAVLDCCIIPGETDDGGLATRIPVFGLTIGIAPAFLADGWKILRLLLLLMKLGGGAYADAAAEDKDKAGVICCCGCSCCWIGEESGDPLERDDRSDEAECIDCLCR